MRPVLLAAAVLMLAAPATALDDPISLIQMLYRPDGMPDTAKEADRFLAADAAKAYKRQLGDSQNAGAAVDFDWRYNSQDGQNTELKIVELPYQRPHAAKPLAVIAASFKNEGRPETITYSLCLGSKGWRIADAHDAGETWTLRDLLGLKGKPLKC
jgi:hypothetical protein